MERFRHACENAHNNNWDDSSINTFSYIKRNSGGRCCPKPCFEGVTVEHKFRKVTILLYITYEEMRGVYNLLNYLFTLKSVGNPGFLYFLLKNPQLD